MIEDERKRTVQAAYDALGSRFGEWDDQIEGDPWERFHEELIALVPDGGRMLDLGCGNGAKIAHLAPRFELVAVDLSEEQLRLARARVPEATFVRGDFAELEFAPGTFDAISALYSLMHVPREEHGALFARIMRWLKPGGVFLASLSHVGGDDWMGEWLGVEMFFSGFDAETNRRLVRDAGFELIVNELVWMREPHGEVAFLWVLARKPS
jgi:ubiquinone/menaquinone biosynthesis C-methylase UbiE